MPTWPMNPCPSRIKGLVHGDYRLDNMLFGRPGSRRDLTVVDWQTVTWGPAMTDVAYFIGCAVPIEDRRTHYDELLRAYHQGLGPDSSVTLDDVRDGVRHQSFAGVMMAVVSAMLVERTDRGDEMFLTMLDRHTSHVLDTGALDILPAAKAAAGADTRPGRRGRARARRRATVERELVLGLRRPGTGRRRLDPARPGAQSERRVDQRAGVRPRYADRRAAGLRGAAAR